MTTIDDVKRFNLKFFDESDGRLAPIEFDKDVPFEVKRMFYVFGVHNQNDRGKHSHHKTKQLLISHDFFLIAIERLENFLFHAQSR